MEELQNKKDLLSSFQKASQKMIATNDGAYLGSLFRGPNVRVTRLRDYKPEEILDIINSGSLSQQQKLSRNYFYKDGFYRRIIIHYATLLKYYGLLIPNPSFGKSLSTDKSLQKRYNNCLDFIDKLKVQEMLTNFSYRALVDGCYYGIIVELNKNNCSILDLPSGYCCSNFKDLSGNDIIEFDLRYFNTIIDPEARAEALNVYPKYIVDKYKKYKAGKLKSSWITIPSDIGICFPFFDGRPLFLNVIPATIDYDESVDTEKERDLEEIKKIIVQKIPHLTDGGLLFEPDEAEVMHAGAVGMLKNNKNVSVLTTYTDVDAIVSKTSSDAVSNTLDQMSKNIYSQAGVSSEIFAASGSSSLGTSLKNDLALMMVLGNRYSSFISNMLNYLYSNSNINFKYTILPISYFNDQDVIETSYKMANMGYSLLLPSIAMGINQRDLSNLKNLENDVLHLEKVMVPLSVSQNKTKTAQSEQVDPMQEHDGPGRPALEQEEKSEKTLANEESLEKTGMGGSD